MDPVDEDVDVVIEIEESSFPPSPVSNSFSDWTVLLTILMVSLLVLAVIVLMKRSERNRRPGRNPDWIESSEEPCDSVDDLRNKRIRSFNTRIHTGESSSEGIEVVHCDIPEILPLSDRGVVKRQIIHKDNVSKSLPAVKSNSITDLPPPKYRPASQDSQEIFLKSRPPNSNLTLCRNTGLPCISPIESLEELNFWQKGHDPWNVSTVPLRVSEKHKQLGEPKTLFCHDMMGGYHYDKYPQGHWDSNNYCFYHWAYIDSFVYFSHSFLTIPPSCWTNSAHKHGVLSLGTLITEGEKGYGICLEILRNQASLNRSVDLILSITRYYGFDGWLVNIENPLPPSLIDRMVEFLKQLTFGVKRINPEGAVIWYDAVTVRGELRWQNKLNQLNKIFFDACDGIFLNYHWSDLALQDTKHLSGARATDVYVGIDVFGRGVPGDGGWNCDFAMKMIRKHQLSAAIFAPGWVYENLPKENFIKNQTLFWDKLKPFTRPHPYVTRQFVTSFCRGIGPRGYHQGRRVLNTDWTNHSSQQLQPHFLDEYYHPGKSGLNILVNNLYVTGNSEAYNGAQNLVCNGEVFKEAIGSDSRLIIRLFVTEIPIYSTILVTYTFREQPEYEGHVRHLLELNLSNPKGPKYITLDPTASVEGSEQLDRIDERLVEKYHLRRSPDIPLVDVGIQAGKEDQHLAYAPLYPEYMDKIDTMTLDKTPEQWRTSYFLIASKDIDKASIREVRLNLLPPIQPPDIGNRFKFSFSVGEIRIIDPACLNSFSIPVNNLKASDFDWSNAKTNTLNVSFLLKWDQPNLPPSDPASHYNIYLTTDKNVSRQYTDFIGQSHTNYFYLKNITIQQSKQDQFAIFAVVQCVTTSGLCLAPNKSAKLQLKWNK
ncbi:Cytosolic endo-beta-N-acetylglucosaminidase [Oopsacas minuta]|uniref:Cytosolic endo-beta-N-acetylglucosaminidase n=1 Tax=Oopsacas minuta TaxID=111878 RepID=A0AAV7K638_9METZ|nr:Cytosolic endo-beta-N-acetylglucosaminidase [Oopsacas minuta]